MEASASLSNIPHEIIRFILLKLAVKSVIRCKCVCKQWRSLIEDSDFKFSYRGQRRVIFLSTESTRGRRRRLRAISRFSVRSTSHDLRLRRHKWPFGQAYPVIRASFENNLKVLCSCNGFVLLLVAKNDIWLWNPSTKCSTKVLECPYQESNPYQEEYNPIIFGGLCYDSSTRDYKVVLSIRPIGWYSWEDFGYPFLIFASLNHKEWRPVKFPCNLNYVRGDVVGGLEFRNTFYWWASDMKDWDWYRNYASDRNRIIYFDPVLNEFKILPLPTSEQREVDFSIFGLGVIDDCSCMAACMVREDKVEPKTKTIWIMKEYGRQESWMIAFAIQNPEFRDTYGWYGLTFYSQYKNAHEVLFLHTVGWCGEVVYVYDRKKDEMKTDLMDFLGGHRSFISMCFYVESLACPYRPQ